MPVDHNARLEAAAVLEGRERTNAERGSTPAASARSVDWSDRGACDAFVDAQYQRLFAWFCWITGRRDRAADLTQESFAAFWESLGRKPVRDPVVWLFRIARNRWRKACRDRRFVSTSESGLSVVRDAAVNAAERIASDEFTQRVAALVRELPATIREAVALRFWSDFSHEQIARVQGVPAALVRWRVHRGRKLLANWLRREGYGGGDG